MKIVAIIPARAGSKGVPGKNIFPINGKPLIKYTIESALESKLLSTVVVSSDDPKVLALSEEFNSVKFHQRSSSIAGDKSPITETVDEILNNFLEEKNYDAVMLLQPTSPIRTGAQIDEAITLLENNSYANSLISVCAMDDVHPARMYWKENDSLNPIMPEFEKTRRQDIPPAYYRNGAIYITKIEAFKKEGAVMVKPSIGYVMPEKQLLNIDSMRDIKIAEVLIKAWKNGEL